MKLPGLLGCPLPRAAIKINYNGGIYTAVKILVLKGRNMGPVAARICSNSYSMSCPKILQDGLRMLMV